MNYSKELFTKKLIEFFDRQDPLKKTIVPDIVEKFMNHQDTVFKHLSKIYAEKNGVEDAVISNDSIFAVPTTNHSSYIG